MSDADFRIDDGIRAPALPLAPRGTVRRWLKVLGPGLITGASDDDPSGIATYSQAGAQFGYGFGWLMLLSFPLMAAIQEICARIGRVTGLGISGNIRKYYSRSLLRAIVVMLLVANIVNLGADLGAMGDALRLMVGGPAKLYVVLFAVGCAALEIFSHYDRYVRILKWTTLSLLAYVATAFAVHVPWGQVLHDTVVPSVAWNRDSILMVVAVLGTTITPYCFFWQSSQEAEDEEVDPAAHPLIAAPDEARAQIGRIRLDTYFGMALSNLISLFIIVTTAATLRTQGITDIQTSADAAQALRPIAGDFAFVLFASGIIGIGLLAVPVLAGSAAYALGEAFDWRTGLSRSPGEAKAFYGAIAVATIVGVGINLVAIDPIKALFWAAVLNGIVAVPLMVVIMVMAANPRVMGDFILPLPLKVMGWACTLLMGVAAGGLLLI